MKKILISIFLTASILVSFGAQTATYKTYVITAAGGTFVTAPTSIPDVIYLTTAAPVTLVGNFNVDASAYPVNGTHWRVYFHLTDLTLNGHTVTIFGQTLNQEQIITNGYYDFQVVAVSGVQGLLYNYAPYDFDASDAIFGGSIQDGTIQLSALASDIPLSSWDTLGRGRIIRGGGSNVAQSYYAAGNAKVLVGDGTDISSVSISGDVSLTNAGVVALDSVIVDADIKTGANIKWQKLATGTASYVAVTNSSGVLTTEQYLQPVRGGTGINTNASNGFATVSAGTWAVGTLTDVRGLDNLSFVTANQGIYYLYFPFAATATNINCRVTSVIAGTDDGEITVANNSGTVMAGSSLTAGVLTIAASAAFGTGYSSTLTSNNTFTAGQSLQLTTAKTTTGGVMHCDVTYTRLQ